MSLQVRFFERKKIDRHIHHLQQAISRQPGGKATAEQEAELEEWNQKLVVSHCIAAFGTLLPALQSAVDLHTGIESTCDGSARCVCLCVCVCVALSLQYVRHYPPGHKYIALLKNADTPEAQVSHYAFVIASTMSTAQTVHKWPLHMQT